MDIRKESFSKKNTGLSQEEILRIQTIFSIHPEIERVVLYGSRAMGKHQPASDIDLTLIGNNIGFELKTKIDFELDDLLLPYRFDISILEKISNPDFIAHIHRVGIPFYTKNTIPNTQTK